MALRLAGAGKQIGMSEGEILGFSAALSSVGVEAEAGGSAFSKIMVQMQLATEKGVGAFDSLKERAEQQGVVWEELESAVRNGGKELSNVAEKTGLTTSELKKMYNEADASKTSLENFADVAGLTGEAFAEMFKSNPTEAIMKFVEGLANAEENGSSAIKVLDDMDITEVRLRDSLLRAASASGTFSDAVEMGNSAFEENTALAEEAGKRYETTESKLKMLKNEAVDTAIDLGGPLVDALRDGLDAAKPLIKGLGDLAEKFSDADPKTQQMIVKLLAYSAAAGPVIKLTGKMSSGIGGLGKAFIDLSGNLAKKKAIKEVTEDLAKGAISGTDFSKVMASGADDVLKFGGAAATASGSGGIGAMMSVLGPLTPAILGVVGVGGALAIGYGAWKTFGEEAWNSSQRVKRWGEDVGSATDTTLQTVQTNTSSATGQFSLMAEGFETNTDSMISNFQKIGSTIENDLTKKLEAYKMAVDLLPTELQSKANEYIENKEKEAQKTLEIVQKNNEEVLRIKKQYVDEEGNVTAQGAKMIQDLMRQSTEEYLNIAVTDADKRKEVMNALNGDLTKSTEEQAEKWLISLAKQRQETKASYQEDIKNYREKLEATGNLSKEEIDTMVGFYEDAQQSSTDAFDAQMALIVKKYPELADKISLANGQLISSAGDGADALVEQNQKILDNSANLSEQLSKNSKETAETLKWVADQSTLAGKTWNDLELLDKEGKVKTNASEIVTEATKDVSTWNNMKLVLHDANLDTNAKEIIGEAAIANGWWDGMAWEDKQAVLHEEFQQTMYKALESSGKWNEMTFEEKKALIYSNTPEKMAETMLTLGVWDDYQPEIKELNAKNESFLRILAGSEDKLANWNSISPETKELLGENYDVLQKIYESEDSYNAWINIPEEEKKLLASNADVLLKITSSEESLNAWNSLPVNEKQILGNNADLLGKVFDSTESLNGWNSLPTEIKTMLANNQDILQKVYDGTITVEDYNTNVVPALKQLYGDNSPLAGTIDEATNAVNYYNRAIIPNSKTLNASTNANDVYGPLNLLRDTWNGIPDAGYKTMTIETKTFGPQLPGRATGTNFHSGGPMMVNDQKGSLYRELIVRPTGESFIPLGRNVILPNEPVGTKVFTASKTKRLIPHYKDGVGVPENSTLIRNLRNSTRVETSNNNSELNSLLRQLLGKIGDLPEVMKAIEKISNRAIVVEQNIDGKPFFKSVAQPISKEQEKRRWILDQVNGRG